MKTLASCILILCLLSMGAVAIAQPKPKDPRTVAIFLYQNVELLDFAGPGEVFTSGGFKVFTVSVDGNEVLSQGFVSIRPQYSIETCPDPDIIVFPGGNSGPSANDPRVMKWIGQSNKKGSFFMSVCTGAGILARSGLLNSFKNITTFHGYIADLQKELPNVNVLKETRFVDNGNVITTAGVSAGIDGALYLVLRTKGIGAAKAAAHYMEYDKWDPDAGLIDRENELIRKLRAQAASGHYTPVSGSDSLWNDTPYAGEFNNLAVGLQAKENFKGASFVLEQAVKVYPSSSILYGQLATVNHQLGKPGPLPEAQLIKMVRTGKVKEAIDRIASDRKKFPSWPTFNENEMNDTGYYLLGKQQFTDAIELFQLIVNVYPQSSNAYDSLGEAYLAAGKKDEARISYLKSLELNPKNENARKIVANL